MLFRDCDAPVDSSRHRLAKPGEGRGAAAIRRQRDLGVVEHTKLIEQPTETNQRRVRFSLTGVFELLPEVLISRRQFEIDPRVRGFKLQFAEADFK